MENRPIAAMVGFAFQGQITGGIKGYPDWATSDHYNVIATTGGQHTRDEIAALVRMMLAERFKLATHTITEQRDGYALVRVTPDRLPTGLRKIDIDCADPAVAANARNARPPANLDDIAPCVIYRAAVTRSGGDSMSNFARWFGAVIGTQVVDETGLEGYYAYTLTYSQPGLGTPPAAAEPPELTTAVKEQLGLRLVPRKLTVTVLIIDHIERPSEN
jgi:uncharacterized protein (TIGR03435 family)